jgi:lipopolysaccharide transport system ATP-binding protein
MSANTCAIRVRNLGKKYTLGGPHEKYFTFRDAIVNSVKAPFKRLSSPDPHHEFWALKDVSFDVEQGEVVGIIGRNGAGKSTLLKILSRITSPTEGTVDLYGRVGSLLEVGTGFHPELTGRENIYLSGSILGMKKREIEDKLDEIVKFSEIEKFLDTPAKRYSSGMYVRLAFAVAAHLEPEILLVDEVLAVGDAAFQKKCLGKMGEVAKEGRTVLFVSHNMGAVTSLCSKAILLNSGKVEYIGETRATIEKYSTDSEFGTSFDLENICHENRPQDYARLTRISLFDENFNPSYSFFMGRPIIIRIECRCHNKMENAEIGFKIGSLLGGNIHLFPSVWEGFNIDLEEGEYTFEITIPQLLLWPGKYFIGCWISKPGQHSDDLVQKIGFIEIMMRDVTGYSPTFEKYAATGYEVYVPSKWKLLNYSKK